MSRLRRMEVLNSKTQNIYPKRLIKHEQQGFIEASPSNSLHEMPSVLYQQWPGRGFNCQRSKVCVSLNGEYTPLARLAKHRLHAHGSTPTITIVDFMILALDAFIDAWSISSQFSYETWSSYPSKVPRFYSGRLFV